MKFRVILGLAATLFIAMQSSGQVQAHVLFVDKTTNIAAIFHSNPNDDPVAGENSELFFDIQDNNSKVRIPYSGYDLLVTDEKGEETRLTTSASGTSVKADFTFPAQGLYKLSLRSQPKYDQFQKVVIDGSIRINRGVGAAQVEKSTAIPTAGLIISATAIGLLAIAFINNKAIITSKSHF